jgi:hypothetical protein
MTTSSWLQRAEATSSAQRLTRFGQGAGIAPMETARAGTVNIRIVSRHRPKNRPPRSPAWLPRKVTDLFVT